MKTYRAVIIVLSVIVVWLAYLQLSGTGKSKTEPSKDMASTSAIDKWHTNTVDKWHTNTMDKWYTNTVELWRTNTVVQNFTNEVVKEVPARLSPAAKEAATVGYKYLNAPWSANNGDALYQASPIAVDVLVHSSYQTLLSTDADTVRKSLEDGLRSRGIQVDKNSPHHLSLTITPALRSDMPNVAMLAFRLELKEKVALRRQDDVIQCDGVVWSTTGSKLVRIFNMAEELKPSIQEQLDKFCADYLKAKGTEKDIKSRVPAIPADFLSGA